MYISIEILWNMELLLCNLFEMAKVEECRGRKPDMIYVFGATDEDRRIKNSIL